MTNGDKIRQMSDEDIVDFMKRHLPCCVCPLDEVCESTDKCRSSLKKWVKQEANNEN